MEDIEQVAELRRMLEDGTAQSIRRQAGASQTDVARALGVSRSAVACWEQRSRRPRRDAALRYHALLRGLQRVTERVAS